MKLSNTERQELTKYEARLNALMDDSDSQYNKRAARDALRTIQKILARGEVTDDVLEQVRTQYKSATEPKGKERDRQSKVSGPASSSEAAGSSVEVARPTVVLGRSMEAQREKWEKKGFLVDRLMQRLNANGGVTFGAGGMPIVSVPEKTHTQKWATKPPGSHKAQKPVEVNFVKVQLDPDVGKGTEQRAWLRVERVNDVWVIKVVAITDDHNDDKELFGDRNEQVTEDDLDA